MKSSRSRYHAFDSLRVLAMLFVVAGHAGVCYMRTFPPRFEWAVHEAVVTRAFDVLVIAAMLLATPIFFLLAGFYGAKLSDASHSQAGFWRNRWRGLIAPFLLFSAIILPLTYAAFAWGWWRQGRCSWEEISEVNFSDKVIDSGVEGFAHLWFLQHLILITAGFWLTRLCLRGAAPLLKRVPALVWPALLMVLSAVLIYAHPGALYVFRNSLIPQPSRLLISSLYFSGGVWLWYHPKFLSALAGRNALFLAVAAAAYLAEYACLKLQWAHPQDASLRAGLAVTGAIFIWSSLWGFVGFFQRHGSTRVPAISRLANASFWVYLVHLPAVVVAHVALYRLPVPVLLKFMIALSAGLGLPLATYGPASRLKIFAAVTAGGPRLSFSAGGVVLNAAGSVLVVNQRGNSWSLPKGHIEHGETALDAARREIAEETGVTQLELVRDLGSYERHRIARDGEGEDKGQRKRLYFFQFKTEQEKLQPADPHHPEARWVEKNEVSGLLTHPKDKRFFEKIKERL